MHIEGCFLSAQISGIIVFILLDQLTAKIVCFLIFFILYIFIIISVASYP